MLSCVEAVEEDLLVDLVGIDADVGAAAFPDQVGNARQFATGEDAAGRVRGGAQDDELGALGDERRQIVGVEAKSRSSERCSGTGTAPTKRTHDS